MSAVVSIPASWPNIAPKIGRHQPRSTCPSCNESVIPELAHTNIYIGIDVGTSGIRAFAIDDQARVVADQRQSLPAPHTNGPACDQDPAIWWHHCRQLLQGLPIGFKQHIRAIAIDATSGTVLLTDSQGRPVSPALMYNDARADGALDHLRDIAPANNPVNAVTAGLPKILWLISQYQDQPIAHIMHQADWLNFQLTRQAGFSDSNNCLKSGYDASNRCWPDWIRDLNFPPDWLPDVVTPGTPLATIHGDIAKDLGLPPDALIVGGTTDSTAAIIATGANQIGDAITSLGSTLVCKVLSDKPVFSSDHGVYSQPYGTHWLVGGGSNSGGAVLRQFFSDAQMRVMSQQLDPDTITGLEYYPLPGTGERFPVNDPTMQNKISPRPTDDVLFFQGLLEGIARIEYNGYRLLHDLGAPYPRSVRSVGGGAANRAWTTIRSRILHTKMQDVEYSEAAYGSALLAKQGFTTWQNRHT